MAIATGAEGEVDDDDEEYDVFRNVGQGLVGHYREIMIRYWQELINEIESTKSLAPSTKTTSSRTRCPLQGSAKS